MFKKLFHKSTDTVKVKTGKNSIEKNISERTVMPEQRKSKLSMEKFKNRTAIGIACIVLALVMAFGISPLVNNAAKAQTVIVRVDKDILSGQKITADKIEKVTVGGYNLPDNVAKQTGDVVGKYATADLKKGDYILSSKLSAEPSFNSPYLYDLPEGKMAISVSLKSLAAGLSGKVQNGDIVSVVTVGGSGSNNKEAVQLPELVYVEVLAATTSKGADNNQQSDDTQGQDIATATLSVNKKQALTLAQYEEAGKLHLVLVSRGNEEKKKMLLEAQENFFAQTQTSEQEGKTDGQ